MVNSGLNKELIMQGVSENHHNMLTTIYYLLKAKGLTREQLSRLKLNLQDIVKIERDISKSIQPRKPSKISIRGMNQKKSVTTTHSTTTKESNKKGGGPPSIKMGRLSKKNSLSKHLRMSNPLERKVSTKRSINSMRRKEVENLDTSGITPKSKDNSILRE